MAVIPLSTSITNYQMPQSVLDVISEQRKNNPITAEEQKYKEEVSKQHNQEESATTSTITDLNMFEEKPQAPEYMFRAVGKSKAYRRRLISDRLKGIIFLFSNLEEQNKISSSVITMVKIKKAIKQTWDIIETDDRDIALTISALEKLISGNFWKDYTIKMVESIKSILSSYVVFSDESTFEKMSQLIKSSEVDILPHTPDE